jgi:hypothetical protein
MQPTPRPDRDDYLVVERIARDMRNQYVASLLRPGQDRARKALRAGRKRCVPIAVVGARYVPLIINVRAKKAARQRLQFRTDCSYYYDNGKSGGGL